MLRIIFLLCIWSCRTVEGSNSCGEVLPGVTRALINGNTEDRAAPWTVSLGSNDDNGFHTHFCTGVIIKEDAILTAAHCVEDRRFNRDSFHVIAGVLDLRWSGAITRKIKETHVHPKYEDPKVYYDVAVVILSQPLTFTADISSICLPTAVLSSTSSKVGLGITVQGWGKDNKGDYGKLLTQIDVVIRSKQECNDKYNATIGVQDQRRIKAFIPELMINSMFCADSTLDGSQVGVCDGDSGGPAISRQYSKAGNQYTLQGLVSGSLHCASEQYPDFYTFISHQEVLPWIIKTANLPSSPGVDSSRSDHDSNHCDIFSDCLHISKCPHYLEQSETLKSLARNTSEFTRIRSELRKLICNQKERKVCCDPSTFSPATARPSPRPNPGPWSGWTVCTVSCGGGSQERSRSDGQIQRQGCNFNACLSWSSWSSCSVICGSGQSTRRSSDGEVEVKECEVRKCDQGELLLVTSTGDSPDYFGSYMGLYQLIQQHNQSPAYKQVKHNIIGTRAAYIYKSDSGNWFAGKELGASSGGLRNTNSSPAPPRSGWQYGDDDGEWVSDPDLTVMTISDTSTLICPVINIRASGAAARKVPDYLGEFTITSQYSAGRPVWRNNRGKYLRVPAGKTTWGVVDNVEINGAGIRSGVAPGLCPASARSRYSKRFNINSWQYSDNGWHDGDITVTCSDQNIDCD